MENGPIVLITQEITRFLGALANSQGQRPKCVFLFIRNIAISQHVVVHQAESQQKPQQPALKDSVGTTQTTG